VEGSTGARDVAGRDLHVPAADHGQGVHGTDPRLRVAGEEVLWHNEARFMAYSVASRAALGDAVSKKDVQRLFPHMLVYGRATMALVRTFTHFPSQVAHCHMLLVAGRTIRHCWRCSTSHPWKCSAAPSTPGHPLPM
jgi:hypothetical protein